MREYQIVVTGGGTSGHAHPVEAVLQALKQNGFNLEDVAWLGCTGKPEESCAAKHNVDFYPITSGKLRRYFSLENIADIFRVLKGIFQSYFLLKKLKPQVLFTSGGYVAVPNILAAHVLKIPIIAYESDSVAGISNRIAFKYASTICLGYAATYDETSKKELKTVIHTGTPIRKSLLETASHTKPAYLNRVDKPILFFLGGSQGAKFLNDFVGEYIEELTKTFFVIHQHGPTHEPLKQDTNYKGYPFVKEDLPEIYQRAELVISRAGSVITELAAFGKACILVPIPKSANNHQYHNAKTLENKQATVLVQESSGKEFLFKKIAELHENDGLRTVLSSNIVQFYHPDAAKKIAEIITKNL